MTIKVNAFKNSGEITRFSLMNGQNYIEDESEYRQFIAAIM